MSEMIDLVIDDASSKMDGAVAHARKEMATIRTGRASSSFVEKLQVEAYGCLLYTSPSPRDATLSRMPSSA